MVMKAVIEVNSDHYTMFLFEFVKIIEKAIFKMFENSEQITRFFFLLTLFQKEGDAEIAAKMQDLALAEGALPRHLHTAMFTQSTDSRMLANRYGFITLYSSKLNLSITFSTVYSAKNYFEV